MIFSAGSIREFLYHSRSHDCLVSKFTTALQCQHAVAQKGANTSRQVDKPIQKMVNHPIIPALFY